MFEAQFIVIIVIIITDIKLANLAGLTIWRWQYVKHREDKCKHFYTLWNYLSF